ncbi:inorganic triphosphatase [Pectobacteriaceae bacterium CE90]|nr:inorganic triphosphatase [Prodigiosinella sp. LS101]WJV53121.1 inorganic triphosphatase [Prodigiosinella sp. LS101]WJV57477.1 inorganic triphosphatase [Pectobacteriaceae bacterium C111]WJY15851.1 inorganic triphosphatase [Pectobacteriaceae bacterium CE90]
MSEEIELKFIVHPDTVSSLRQQLNDWQSEYSHSEHLQAQQLANTYYETKDGYLRQHGIGLRVRGENGHYEMTAKTAGKVVGSLHQHPEYNVDLTSPQLDISLLPEDIWPEGCDVAALTQALQPLFSTNFRREKWAVTYAQSVIEMVFDSGEVVAGHHREPICELELELKVGRIEDLLSFANELSDVGGLRQGSLSKAARGYHLAKGNPHRERRPLAFMPVEPKMTLDQAIRAGLEYALSHWQYHEELWVRGNAAAREALPEAGTMLREMLVLVGGVVPRKVTTLFRAALSQLEALVDANQDAEAVCYAKDYLKSKLVLTSWLVEAGWHQYMDNKERMRLQGSYKRFADIMLSRTLSELKQVFSHSLDTLQYSQQLPRLRRGVCAFLLLSGFYPVHEATSYLRFWRDIEDIIAHLSPGDDLPHQLELSRKQAISQPPFWLSSANN